MRPLSFKARLTLFLVVFAIVPLMIIGYNSYSTILDERIRQHSEDLSNSYKTKSLAFENTVNLIEENLENLINTTAYFDTQAERSLEKYFEQLNNLRINGEKPFIVVYDRDEFLYSEGDLDLQRLNNMAYLSRNDTHIISNWMENNGEFAIVVNRLTESNTRICAGVVLKPQTIDSLLSNSNTSATAEWAVYHNETVISQNDHFSLESDVVGYSGINLLSHSVFVPESEHSPSYMIVNLLDGNLKLWISSPEQEHASLKDAVRMKSLIVVMILIALSVALSIFYAGHMYNPIRVIEKKTRKIIEGNLSSRIQIWHSGIFKPIVEGINSVADTSETDYNNLLNQSMEMLQIQDNLIEVNQSLESNHEALKSGNRRLEYSKEKYQALIENIHDLVWVVDLAGNFTFVNDAFQSTLGLDPEALIDKPFKSILSDSTGEDLSEKLLQSMLNGNIDSIHVWFRKHDSSDAEIFLTNTVHIYKNGLFAGVQGISRPLSENWLLTQKLSRRSQALEDIRDITRTLATENNIEALFDLVVSKIYELYDVAICSIRTVNDEGHLEMVNVTGPASEFIGDVTIKNKDDVRYKALKENRMIYLEDMNETHLENYKELKEAVENVESIVFLPLADASERTGVISIVFKELLPQNELMILSTIGIQSTLAIKKAKLYEKQREEFLATIRVLVTAIEAKDAYTEGHSTRVSEFATIIAGEMGLSSQEVEDIQFAGLLHDIGKIGIDDFILTKKGRLSPFESDKIKEHPEIGLRILQPIGFNQSIMDGVTLHHKRYDLKGYPHSIQVEDLPLSAAIIGVSDALDAMTSNRSYSNGRPLEVAIQELINHKETQFAPQVVESILRIYENDLGALESIITGKVQVMS